MVASATLEEPIVLRNSGVVLAMRYFGACIGYVFAVCFALIAIHSVAQRSFLDALLWAGSGVLAASAGVALWSATRKMARNTVRLTKEGVYFHFHSKQNRPDIFLAWFDISKVTATRANKVQVCSVFASGDRVVQFSSSHFARPKHVARVVAEHAGLMVS